MFPTGTLANVAAILAGSFLGLVLHGRMPLRVKTMVFQGLGLCVLTIGLGMALKMQNPVAVVLSVVLGGIAGELLGLEAAFERLAAWLKRAIKSKNETFTDGFVTATLIYCIGSMAILGALDEGLRGDPTILFTKAVLDGFASIALAATYGLGVAFSCVPLFLYQFGITLSAQAMQPFFTEPLLAQLTGCGGVLILGIGINLLELKRIPLTNLLPALPIVVVITCLMG
jgi:uncharacterized membrane protein YqgA involved in biofilm formation